MYLGFCFGNACEGINFLEYVIVVTARICCVLQAKEHVDIYSDIEMFIIDFVDYYSR